MEVQDQLVQKLSSGHAEAKVLQQNKTARENSNFYSNVKLILFCKHTRRLFSLNQRSG